MDPVPKLRDELGQPEGKKTAVIFILKELEHKKKAGERA